VRTHRLEPGEEKIMVRYFYAWAPLVIVGTVALLSLPGLALIALMIVALVALVALGALAWAIVAVSYVLGCAISRRWEGRSSATPQTAAAPSPANSRVRRIRSVPAGATVLLAQPPSERDT
jgi:membrane protein implicated in regulation of membrane protease activity